MNNNQKKLISIIIAAYNSEKYLAQAIESAIEQTYQHIEIVVVNDGSTDDTINLIESYAKKDSRIVLISQANAGPSTARNTGFKNATGEYFCILDADDIMLPDKIESQVEFLEKHEFADFTYSKVYYFMEGENTIYSHDLATINGTRVYKKLLQYGNFIYTSTVFFRRSVFETYGGFDEQLRSAEEFDYWLSLAGNGVNFLHQDKYLTLCRSRGDGLTSDSVTMYSTAVAVFDKHFGHNKYPNLAKATSRQYIKNKFLLAFSKARKPAPATVTVVGKSSTNFFSISHHINNLFILLRKIKFSFTFKKIHDKKLEQYLMKIESLKKHETSY
ncbi:MAG: glycosyltransferase [Candidatus Paceibacterota bacterium]